MKILNLVTHANMQHQLSDILRDIEQVNGFTFTPAQGHGTHVDSDPFLSSRDRVVGYTPRIKVEILLADEDVEPVLSCLRDAMIHERNQGLYWVCPVDSTGRL
ncbi:MAG: DUF3240 domain-containing protein [Zetaproteobacteria bacterium CG12_big_fil_rev_8_21_14_0_65_54_13]|nr:MAG: hypothetical protein COX55_01635 [Zetaproteobacteria bacterium CG23_combo_of_CG06-09_8_20_14_all_54_7]PIW46937.1 MAG: DUF3240 domain-containing protein [Zetaproteobacteria bacterium CG12_big_fil_rev_8_21_14_0_65_54_13]PIX55878.1 MAG: DUF3240 domain-containing protein [Zetaproteobacteria bacterium CG_4_10_14_3_um_filter_54_28]PJA28731.1 MAG: DUF3240 domain-containing protein [Zetaproteobacteria bacterium CG_4_9_14_3_um_filter_54_145]